MAQLKRSAKTYTQRFLSGSGFLTNPHTNRMIQPLENPAVEDFCDCIEAAGLDPIDGDWDLEDLTRLSGEDLWRAEVNPSQSRGQRGILRKEGTAREDAFLCRNWQPC